MSLTNRSSLLLLPCLLLALGRADGQALTDLRVVDALPNNNTAVDRPVALGQEQARPHGERSTQSGTTRSEASADSPESKTKSDEKVEDQQLSSAAGDSAQNQPTIPTHLIEVTATRLADDPFSQPYAFFRYDRDDLDDTIGRTALDRINYGPGVFIQHTAPNQTSPFIRGLTGEQTLLLLDGVRFNHAFMRPGPNQYAALIPDASIGSTDVILGSSSVVTGSDGLTGAINFDLAPAGRGVEKAASPWLRTRVDSANGAILQGGVDGRVKNWAYSVDFDGRDFHDRVGGKDFESRLFGVDTNTFDEIPNTSYEQIAGGLRLAYLGLESHLIEIKSGYTQQSDAPRPDGYFENTGDASRVSRRFDPQTFSFIHLKDSWAVDESWLSTLRTTLWWHHHYEDQKREQIRNQGSATEQYRLREKEDALNAFGLDVQATTYLGAEQSHEITWGFTGSFENTDNDFQEFRSPAGSTDPSLASPFEVQNWDNRTTVSDNSDYWSVGIFLQDSWDVTEDFNLLVGARYSYYDWDFGNVDNHTEDFTGSVRGLWWYHPEQNIFLGASRGFRAPNLTNLDGAVDRGSSGTPAQGNPNLDPEISYTAEIGWRWQRDRNTIGVSAFYTYIDDFIQRDFSNTGMFTNVEDANLRGFETIWDLGIPCMSLLPDDDRLAFVGSMSLVKARRDVPQPGGGTNTDNISRANRFYGRFGLKYQHGRSWWGQAQVRWHDSYDDVARDPSDSDANDRRLTVAGSADGSMPGYGVLDLQLGWKSEDGLLSLSFFVENVLDKTYREVGSGADGPGRNIGLSASIRF